MLFRSQLAKTSLISETLPFFFLLSFSYYSFFVVPDVQVLSLNQLCKILDRNFCSTIVQLFLIDRMVRIRIG